LIEVITAETIIADKGYDADAIIDEALAQGMEVVIPPRSNRKIKRSYDRYLYKLRHLVENAFLHMKEWRGIACRFAKKHSILRCCCTNSLLDDVAKSNLTARSSHITLCYIMFAPPLC